jgi:hypothetical protein
MLNYDCLTLIRVRSFHHSCQASAGKTKFLQKITNVRLQLAQSLRTHFYKEINWSLQHLHETIALYTRFIRSEQEGITR